MCVCNSVILLFEDSDGFAATISGGLQPNPTASFQTPHIESMQTQTEMCFQLRMVHCEAVNHWRAVSNQWKQIYLCSAILSQCTAYVKIIAEICSKRWIAGVSELEREPQRSGSNRNRVPDRANWIARSVTVPTRVPVRTNWFGIQCVRIVSEKITQKPPSSLQIRNEVLACSVQLARVMKIPTFLLVGLSGQSKPRKSYEEDLKNKACFLKKNQNQFEMTRCYKFCFEFIVRGPHSVMDILS
ncbi:hypothetical protein POM88_052176 [Heracleum sosnowskyi]|uniref:DUF7894 domain-containing protein n=1 Tax=Heracleum sosnowskyi TaxID=360622 RepID=A0AAD8GSJ4_9APIA|nr:hypothetical protein POM88_052176 [Heracleum sosnowskyi]